MNQQQLTDTRRTGRGTVDPLCGGSGCGSSESSGSDTSCRRRDTCNDILWKKPRKWMTYCEKNKEMNDILWKKQGNEWQLWKKQGNEWHTVKKTRKWMTYCEKNKEMNDILWKKQGNEWHTVKKNKRDKLHWSITTRETVMAVELSCGNRLGTLDLKTWIFPAIRVEAAKLWTTSRLRTTSLVIRNDCFLYLNRFRLAFRLTKTQFGSSEAKFSPAHRGQTLTKAKPSPRPNPHIVSLTITMKRVLEFWRSSHTSVLLWLLGKF